MPLSCSGLVSSANQRLASLRSSRPRWMAPWRSAPTMLRDAGVGEDLGDGHAGRAGAGDHDPQVGHVLVDDLQRVLERGQRDHRGAVLVVVEDGDVEARPQPLLDLEALPARRCPRG